LGVEPPSVDLAFNRKSYRVLVATRDSFDGDFTERLDKRWHLWLGETLLAKTKFAILVTSKGVHMAFDCDEGAVIEATGEL